MVGEGIQKNARVHTSLLIGWNVWIWLHTKNYVKIEKKKKFPKKYFAKNIRFYPHLSVPILYICLTLNFNSKINVAQIIYKRTCSWNDNKNISESTKVQSFRNKICLLRKLIGVSLWWRWCYVMLWWRCHTLLLWWLYCCDGVVVYCRCETKIYEEIRRYVRMNGC